jgi:competence protein ComEC
MSSWGMIPFVRILCWFIPGVFIGFSEFIKIPITYVFAIVIAGITLLLLRKPKRAIYYWLLLVLLGFATNQYYQIIHPKHLFASGKTELLAEVIDTPVVKEKVITFPVKILNQKINSRPNIICYLQKSDSSQVLNIGDKIEITGYVNDINPPKNLGEFNYQNYLANKRIFQTIYVSAKEIFKVDEAKFSIFKIANTTRKWAEIRIEQMHLKAGHEGIVKALLLGLKTDLTASTKLSFTRTGAMHVLAVSGLHVGIIFLVFNFLFKGVQHYQYGQLWYAILMIFGVWSFAFVTGLAPSVNRAAIMFTILIIGKALKRDVNIYNSIAASAFLMLINNPYLLFDVGFQLSYSAVVGIVFFYPRIYAWFNHLPRWLDACWSLTAVAIAAQIATLPFTLIYFHQLPTYFWLSNIIVIPAATIILYMGMAYLFVSQLLPVTNLFSSMLDMILELMQFGISWLSNLPGAVIGNIHLSQLSIVMLLVSLLSLVVYVASKSVKWKIGLFVAFTAFLSIRLYDNYTRIRQQGQISYKLRNNQVSLHYKGTAGVLLSQNQISKTDFQYHIKPSLSLLGITRLDTVVTEPNKKYKIKEK